MVRRDFNIRFRKQFVLKMLDCSIENPIYEELSREFDQLEQICYEKIDAKALLSFGILSEHNILLVLLTLGEEISDYSTGLLQNGQYIAGMLVNAMADDYMFQMDEKIEKDIIQESTLKGFGIAKRLEAPQDISFQEQKEAFIKAGANDILGVQMNDSYMMNPIKSSCQIYILSENMEDCNVKHDCSSCNMQNCKLKNTAAVTVTVKEGNKLTNIQCDDGQSIWEAMSKQGIYVPSPCGGLGLCGKCKIKLVEGILEPTTEDFRFFTEQEIENGYRLACKSYPTKNCTILRMEEKTEEISIITDYKENFDNKDDVFRGENKSKKYAIAIDIGTTTIAMQLIDLGSKEVIDTYTSINHQRVFGADVVARIQASNSGNALELSRLIKEDLKQGINKLIPQSPDSSLEIVIAANTTMIHLLMGYSCENLGTYPFSPVHLEVIHTSLEELIGDAKNKSFAHFERSMDLIKRDIKVTILPGFSAFIGADIVSGLLSCELAQSEDISLFLDLGTNGEMAIGNKNKILVTSTAAGPTFEGGNIICGMASVMGAISGVTIEANRVELKTIGNKPPIGICGSGVVDVIYELFNNKMMDETGLLKEEFFEYGLLLASNEVGEEIRIYQKDIREIQLAKAAIRAGIEILIRRYGITYDKIKHLFLAGGFGYAINIDKAIGIGLLPRELRDRISIIGNSSLKGAIRYLVDENSINTVKEIKDVGEEIVLANDPDFMELYINQMSF